MDNQKRGQPVTSQQYRAALERLGWTQAEAAAELGVDARTSRRYALGECPIPLTVQKLIECRELSNVKPGRPVRTK
jgi:transcriptional regulator with XRE-family HTH domain